MSNDNDARFLLDDFGLRGFRTVGRQQSHGDFEALKASLKSGLKSVLKSTVPSSDPVLTGVSHPEVSPADREKIRVDDVDVAQARLTTRPPGGGVKYLQVSGSRTAGVAYRDFFCCRRFFGSEKAVKESKSRILSTIGCDSSSAISAFIFPLTGWPGGGSKVCSSCLRDRERNSGAPNFVNLCFSLCRRV